ncbi:MAG TPA: thiamine pyrophosphate-dependent enzyme, partial [Thermoanaerobaculia bacterium]|nr:thiamine pyrophosphate-dependent enzyme [Thermoanaerobaculia bacterium]
MTISVLDRDASPPPAVAADGPAMDRETVLADYRLAWESRQASLLGRREVLTGKAKFGIFGDGKEVAQLALAKVFRPGDFRSGYYRDQTFMLALGLVSIEELFAQLYANPEVDLEPCSAGRSMNAHFATCLLDADGGFRNLTELLNSAADLSPVAAQMPRLVGLAYASRLYRELPDLASFTRFSRHGDEIAWGTIGNASCAEGLFWEAVNAVGVLRSPMVLSIWDDGYGISVPNELQVAKDLSELLAGFRRAPGTSHGYDLYRVRGWEYPELCAVYSRAADVARREHVPAIVHVVEMTQPQGHSTSGSHERYKPKERLAWEAEVDCLRRMRQWMIAEGLANAGELDALEEEATRRVRGLQRAAWEAFRAPIEQEQSELMALLAEIAETAPAADARADAARPAVVAVERVRSELARQPVVLRRDLVAAAQGALVDLAAHAGPGGRPAGELPAAVQRLAAWRRERVRENAERYDSDLYSASPLAALAVPAVAAVYTAESPVVDGHKVMNACFDAALARYPNVVAIGEDVGQIGDVNQGFAGLQAKYGKLRVSDTGIREATI